jgi:hypothetical protein
MSLLKTNGIGEDMDNPPEMIVAFKAKLNKNQILQDREQVGCTSLCTIYIQSRFQMEKMSRYVDVNQFFELETESNRAEEVKIEVSHYEHLQSSALRQPLTFQKCKEANIHAMLWDLRAVLSMNFTIDTELIL